MILPSPQDLIKEASDTYLTEVGRALMRRGIIRSQEMNGKLVIRAVSGTITRTR